MFGIMFNTMDRTLKAPKLHEIKCKLYLSIIAQGSSESRKWQTVLGNNGIAILK